MRSQASRPPRDFITRSATSIAFGSDGLRLGGGGRRALREGRGGAPPSRRTDGGGERGSRHRSTLLRQRDSRPAGRTLKAPASTARSSASFTSAGVGASVIPAPGGQRLRGHRLVDLQGRPAPVGEVVDLEPHHRVQAVRRLHVLHRVLVRRRCPGCGRRPAPPALLLGRVRFRAGGVRAGDGGVGALEGAQVARQRLVQRAAGLPSRPAARPARRPAAAPSAARAPRAR